VEPRNSNSSWSRNNKKYLINYVENINGKILSEKDFAKSLRLTINNKLRKGIDKLLKKGYILDFYGKRNFVQSKNKKIYYVDTRMPLFTKNSKPNLKSFGNFFLVESGSASIKSIGFSNTLIIVLSTLVIGFFGSLL
jgi:hypothetical protein